MALAEDPKTRMEARRELIEEANVDIDYEALYRDEDHDRKIAAGIVAGDVFQRTSALNSRDYLRNPIYYGPGGSQYWGNQFHIRLPVWEALPRWAWFALFWSTGFFVTLIVILILLSA